MFWCVFIKKYCFFNVFATKKRFLTVLFTQTERGNAERKRREKHGQIRGGKTQY